MEIYQSNGHKIVSPSPPAYPIPVHLFCLVVNSQIPIKPLSSSTPHCSNTLPILADFSLLLSHGGRKSLRQCHHHHHCFLLPLQNLPFPQTRPPISFQFPFLLPKIALLHKIILLQSSVSPRGFDQGARPA